MRVGLVSPYSLTVPGGVQSQVLGLARELRRRGHEARVLGPCDGPPPESFVTPLGNSLPTAANGSMAPLAPDVSAALRTIRALNDEEFDVIHLHEPMAPGITMTALLLHRAPTVGTFHAAGSPPAIGRCDPRCAACRIGSTTASSCPRTRSSSCGSTSAASTTSCSTASTSTRSGPHRRSSVTRRAARRGHVPTIFFCGRHEERKGLSVLFARRRALDGPVTVWVASNGPETASLMARHRVEPEHRLARPDPRGGEVQPPAFVRRVLRPVARRRVVRRRAGRGDGGRCHRGRQRARRLPQRRHRPGRLAARAARRRRRTRPRAARGARRFVAGDPTPGGGGPACRGFRHVPAGRSLPARSTRV